MSALGQRKHLAALFVATAALGLLLCFLPERRDGPPEVTSTKFDTDNGPPGADNGRFVGFARDNAPPKHEQFSVRVRVHDPGGDVVEGAEVWADGANSAHIPFSASKDGGLYVGYVPSGRYEVHAKSDLWGATHRGINVDGEQIVVLGYRPRSKIRGLVLDGASGDDRVLALQVLTTEEESLVATRDFSRTEATSGPGYDFEIGGLGVGRFLLVGRTRRVEFRKAVDIPRNGDVVHVEITSSELRKLPRFDEVIRFFAVDAATEVPLGGVKLNYAVQYPYNMRTTGYRITNDDGGFELRVRRVPVGAVFAFSVVGYQDSILEVTDEVSHQLRKGTTAVYCSRWAENRVCWIRDQFGAPLVAVAVAVREFGSRNTLLQRKTGFDGKLDLSELDPGNYRFSFLLPHHLTAGVMREASVSENVELPAKVEDPERNVVPLAVGRTLVVVTEQPVAATLIVVLDSDNRTYVVTKKDSVASLTGLPQEGILHVFLVRYKNSRVHYGHGRADLGTTLETLFIDESILPEVEVQLVESNGSPVRLLEDVRFEVSIDPETRTKDWCGEVLGGLRLFRRTPAPGVFRVRMVPGFRGTMYVFTDQGFDELAYPIGALPGTIVLAGQDYFTGIVKAPDGSVIRDNVIVKVIYDGEKEPENHAAQLGRFYVPTKGRTLEAIVIQSPRYRDLRMEGVRTMTHYDISLDER